MAETITAVYDRLANAEQTVDELVSGGLERSLVQLDELSEEIDLVALGYVENDRLTSGQAAAWGLLAGAVLGVVAALLAIWIFPPLYRGVGPVLVAGPGGALVLGALLGALSGGLAGAMAQSRPPRDLVRVREQARVVVQATADNARQVFDIMRRHQPLSISHSEAS